MLQCCLYTIAAGFIHLSDLSGAPRPPYLHFTDVDQAPQTFGLRKLQSLMKTGRQDFDTQEMSRLDALLVQGSGMIWNCLKQSLLCSLAQAVENFEGDLVLTAAHVVADARGYRKHQIRLQVSSVPCHVMRQNVHVWRNDIWWHWILSV